METALSSTGQIIWRWLELLGLDAETFFADQGVNQRLMQEPGARVPTATWDAIRAEAIRRVGDPCAGLKASRCWHPSNIGALGFAWLASSTLRTALKRLERYGRIVGQAGRWELADHGKGLRATLVQTRWDPETRALATDMAMSIVFDMCRVNYGDALQALKVTLQRSEPECADSYRRFYGGEVAFSAEADSFTIDCRDADRLLPSSNKHLAGVHDGILAEQLARLDRNDVVARCKAVILEQLSSGDISEEEVASALHMSSRTLQRKLEGANTGFSRVLDDLRRELAERYLADPGNTVSEVAFLLGFSQQSSLTRASNRWFGMSPTEYRQRL
jgi:AraC-like DNA-binding protein